MSTRFTNDNEPLGRIMVAGRDAYRANTMTGAELAAYEDARNTLVEWNTNFISKKAHDFLLSNPMYSNFTTHKDLLSAGHIDALLRTPDWDPSKGAYTTFLGGILLKAFTVEAGRAEHGKRYNAEMLAEVNYLAREYPSLPPLERAQFSRWKELQENPQRVKEWTAVASMWEEVIHIDAYLDDEDDSRTAQIAAPDRTDASTLRAPAELRDVLMRYLNPVETTVLVMRYGLGEHEPMRPAEVAEELAKFKIEDVTGVPVSRRVAVVTEIEAAALEALRDLGPEIENLIVAVQETGEAPYAEATELPAPCDDAAPAESAKAAVA